MSDVNSVSKVSFKDTLNLPRTEFPIRARAGTDHIIIERWHTQQLSEKAALCNQGAPQFTLSDGPPYANGSLHLGHAYNKILKDIIGKFHRMSGKQVFLMPGWDCHGLPIEFAVTKEKKYDSRAAVIEACRAYAQKWIDIQKEELKQLGLILWWNKAWATMYPWYESSVIRAFKEFVTQGYIERKNKTVPWCPTCGTVLAAAEIEYKERQDPSVYVLFPMSQSLAWLDGRLADKVVNFLVWTTTPWTLPLNRAVLVRPHTHYAVVHTHHTYVLVGAELVAKLSSVLGEHAVIAQVHSDELIARHIKAYHPFIKGQEVPVIADASVSIDEGTANVHCAPGCGPQDYEVAVTHQLEIFSPVNKYGKYEKGIIPEQLEGMSVAEGNNWVIETLRAHNALFLLSTITHSYPHCWRCRKGLIFRATKQWFCDLSRHHLRTHALEAIDKLAMLPAASKNRFKATVEGRLEWCLSRQRVWGVPIPALLCAHCDYIYLDAHMIEKVARVVEQEGIEGWNRLTVEDLLPEHFTCPECKTREFVKEHDILDVWFDAGLAHYALHKQFASDSPVPVDLYIEGKDQHRGWFQSSLLTSIVLNKKAPMRTIITHGFTVDERGHKMSKSLGNVVSPQEMVNKLSLDGLRLWASSVDYADDAVVSAKAIENVGQVHHKIRNSCRFLLSNLYDFTNEDRLPLDQLLLIDQWALIELYAVQAHLLDAYARYDFTQVFHLLADYCAVQLSAFYLDISKDRLYVERANGHARRSAQTTYWYILDTLMRLIAPIMSVTAEELSDYLQGAQKPGSIHLQPFASLTHFGPLIKKWWHMFEGDRSMPDVTTAIGTLFKHTHMLKEIRSAVLKSIEQLRARGDVKHSLEARVMLHVDGQKYPAFHAFVESVETSSELLDKFLQELFIVSQCVYEDSGEGLEESKDHPGVWVFSDHAQGTKCPRCWQWDISAHKDGLCCRCQAVLS